MSFTYVLGRMISLAVMMLLGFAAYRGHLLDEKSTKAVTDLVVDITLPCMILASLAAAEASRKDVILMIVCGTALYGFFILLAELLPRFLPVKDEDMTCFKYYMAFTNNAFMGFPVIKALWGSRALVYASLMNISINVLIYSYGIGLFAKAAGGQNRLKPRDLLNIPIASSVVTMILALIPFHFSGAAQFTLETIGDATVPLSMIVVGATLASRPLSGLFERIDLYIFALFRMLILPLIVFALLWFLPISPMIKGVMVVISAMPGSANGVLFAHQYRTNRTLSSRYVFISTVLSVITIPLVAVIMLAPLGI